MVEKQLERLLYRFDCVILPGFGAFLAKNKPSQYHETTQVFYPPQRKLSFNAQLKSDDGLLINSISKAHDISYEQANKEVSSFVDDLWYTLEKEEKVILDQLGRFEQTQDGVLRFYPEDRSLRKDTFGLKPLHITKNETKEVGDNRKITPVEEPHINNIKKDHGLGKIYRYAAIGLLAVALTGSISYGIYQNAAPDKSEDALSVNDNALKEKLETANFKLQTALPTLNIKLNNKETQEEKKRYHIIAGAFRQKENALKKTRQLREKGFESKLLGQNKYGLHQVNFRSFSKKEKAVQELKQIKRQQDENAWLLVKEF